MSHQRQKGPFPNVSIREMLWGTGKSRELKHDLDLARQLGVGLVQVRTGGMEVPACVTLLTTLTHQVYFGDRAMDTWAVTIGPSDSEALRRRLFAETNATHMGALDVPVAGMSEASYDAVKALRRAHNGFSNLNPPRVGTFVEMSFSIAWDMTRIVTFRPSSVDVLRRARGRAKHHNELARARWSAAHFPLNGPVKLGGLTVWPWWRIDDPTLMLEPEIPDIDPWEPGGDLYTAIGDVVAEQFYEILESLWKATFKQDPFVADQLTAVGYHLEQIDATRMGVGSLRELMERFQNKGHMTMMADPDVIQDLDDDSLRNFTQL